MDNPDHFDAYNDSSFAHKANSFIRGEDEISWGTPWRLGSHTVAIPSLRSGPCPLARRMPSSKGAVRIISQVVMNHEQGGLAP